MKELSNHILEDMFPIQSLEQDIAYAESRKKELTHIIKDMQDELTQVNINLIKSRLKLCAMLSQRQAITHA